MTIKYWLVIVIIFCLFIAGCNTQSVSSRTASLTPQKPVCSHTKETTKAAPLKHSFVPVGFLEIVATQPPEPAVLTLGEKLNIEVAYDLESLDSVSIWARPFVNGNRASGYSAHHLVSADKEKGNPGIADCWFYFDKPTKIDEVRIFMQDAKTGQIVREISYKINAEWK